MGLDITAYRKLAKVEGGRVNDDGYAEDANGKLLPNARTFYDNTDFPGRIAPIEGRVPYTYEDADDVFSAGYMGYGFWREELAKLAGYPLTEVSTYGITEHKHAAACWNGATGPFSELINFADNEGTIGSVAAAKLLQDFIEWDEKAQQVQTPRFYERYSAMRKGLEMAADDGALRFS